MKTSRRSFFGFLATPLAAKLKPALSPLLRRPVSLLPGVVTYANRTVRCYVVATIMDRNVLLSTDA